MCPLLCHPARGNKARLIQGESELQYSSVITLPVTTWCATYLVVLGNWKRARSFKTILGRWLEESSVYYRLTSTNQPEEPVGSPKLSPKPVEEKKRAHSEEPLVQLIQWKISFSSHITDAKAASVASLGTTIVVFASLSLCPHIRTTVITACS